MSEDNESWCQSTEDQPDETYEPDHVEVQADYHPDRWEQ